MSEIIVDGGFDAPAKKSYEERLRRVQQLTDKNGKWGNSAKALVDAFGGRELCEEVEELRAHVTQLKNSVQVSDADRRVAWDERDSLRAEVERLKEDLANALHAERLALEVIGKENDALRVEVERLKTSPTVSEVDVLLRDAYQLRVSLEAATSVIETVRHLRNGWAFGTGDTEGARRQAVSDALKSYDALSTEADPLSLPGTIVNQRSPIVVSNEQREVFDAGMEKIRYAEQGATEADSGVGK